MTVARRPALEPAWADGGENMSLLILILIILLLVLLLGGGGYYGRGRYW